MTLRPTRTRRSPRRASSQAPGVCLCSAYLLTSATAPSGCTVHNLSDPAGCHSLPSPLRPQLRRCTPSRRLHLPTCLSTVSNRLSPISLPAPPRGATRCCASRQTMWSLRWPFARQCVKRRREDSRIPSECMRLHACPAALTGPAGAMKCSTRCSRYRPMHLHAMLCLLSQHSVPTASRCAVEYRPCHHWRHHCRHCPHSRCALPGSQCRFGCWYSGYRPPANHQPLVLLWAHGRYGHLEQDQGRPD